MSLLSTLGGILFVGHSLFGFTIPALTAEALRVQGAAVKVEAQIVNGAPLAWNWTHSATAEGVDARAALPTGAYGTVILTEAVPLEPQLRWNDSPGYAKRFYDLAVTARPDAQLFLHETWTSLLSGTGVDVPHDDGDDVPWRERLRADLPRWQGIVDAVNAARVPGQPPMRLIPAGQAMGRAADAIAEGTLPGVGRLQDLFIDDIHTNDLGNYLVTMVIYAAVTGQSPEGLPPRLTRTWRNRTQIVTPELAAAMQRIAWETVQAHARDPVPPQAAAAGTAADAAAAGTAADAAAAGTAAAAAAAAPPVAAPPRPAFAPVTNPNLALGLSGIHDWSVQQPFLDIVKTARPWTGHLPGQWGGWDHDRLAAGGWLDAEGWPRAIPPELEALALLILTDLPVGAVSTAGRYRLTYEGRGQLEVGGRAQVVAAVPGEIRFDFTPGPGTVLLTLRETDPADPLRRIRVVREDRAALLDAGAIFNPDWLERIRGVRVIRLMDWMAANDSTLGEVADRPLPSDYTWARIGVPAEVMVALANELGAEPWFTLPHLATDAFMRTYAEIVRDGLAPGLRAHVEFSNEVWNWQFAQARWAAAQAQARWGARDTWVQYYGLRAAQMAAIWDEVFGAEAPARLFKVIATQTGWLGLEDDILLAPLWLAEDPARNRPPVERFDGYAITAYAGGGLGTDAKAPLVRQWLIDSRGAALAGAMARGLTGDAAITHAHAHRYDVATGRALAELREGAMTGRTEDTLADLIARQFPHHAAVARRHGLKLMMYEGGSHVAGTGPWIGDEELTEFFIHLSYSEGMGAFYTDLMRAWAAVSDAPFNAFVDVLAPNRWGSWGALRHLDDDNPRWRAIAGFGP